MQGEKMDQLKTAMLFLVQKLGPMERLCVITFSDRAKELWPLQHITEASRRELQELISNLEAAGGGGGAANIEKGLRDGVNLLAASSVGRVTAVMLVSGGQHERGDPTMVEVFYTPVFTFCFGGTDSSVHKVAAESLGGTFTHVQDGDTGGLLTMAFSQCLAGLLTVEVQNLELSVADVGGESRVVKVTTGSYLQEEQEDGSVMVRFGNLYSTEVRTVIVELLLPTISSDRSAEILNVTYSYNRSASVMMFVAPSETLTVWRSGGVELSELEKPAGLLSEESRLQTAQMIKEARTMADHKRLGDAQDKLEETHRRHNMPSLLRTELEELFKTQESYEKQGRPYALSWESCHDRQRFAGNGGGATRLFATPRMDKYLEQAKKFLDEPTTPLPSVDDDVKEEVGALPPHVVARREEHIRLFTLSASRLRRRPPTIQQQATSPPLRKIRSRGIFGMFRKKSPRGSMLF
uniref:Uncharacterized protein n=1 Tax=Avena sativa TaxID=4498 RepID=A0ACD5YCN5_AVESA